MTTSSPHSDDRRWLAAAIRLGAARNGQTWPNPAVGCVLVRDGRVVGSGVTGPGGTPHGETVALEDAGEAARGATAHVSLEPCNHHGRTPPCTEALVAAGIARVVIAHGDPDPRVSGSGARRLRDAGVAVDFEPFADLRAMAAQAHRGHVSRMLRGRPFVTLKLALSADGGIGLPGHGQVPITGEATNRLMHGLRARTDAIAVGAGTWAADHPRLTVRLPGLGHRSPQRVVFGGKDAGQGAWHLSGHDLGAGLAELSRRGIGTLLVEGGARLARALLDAGLVDELILLAGPVTLGAGALRPFAAHPFDDRAGSGLDGWRPVVRRSLGQDTLLVLVPPAPSPQTKAA